MKRKKNTIASNYVKNINQARIDIPKFYLRIQSLSQSSKKFNSTFSSWSTFENLRNWQYRTKLTQDQRLKILLKARYLKSVENQTVQTLQTRGGERERGRERGRGRGQWNGNKSKVVRISVCPPPRSVCLPRHCKHSTV